MREMKRLQSDLGEVFVAAEVIEQLVEGAIGEQSELLPLNRATEDEGLLEALARAYKGRGIEIKAENDQLKIRLQLVAHYGISIPKAAERLIALLRQRLRELAGLEVADIEIEIRGIKLPPRVLSNIGD